MTRTLYAFWYIYTCCLIIYALNLCVLLSTMYQSLMALIKIFQLKPKYIATKKTTMFWPTLKLHWSFLLRWVTWQSLTTLWKDWCTSMVPMYQNLMAFINIFDLKANYIATNKIISTTYWFGPHLTELISLSKRFLPFHVLYML